MKRLDVREFRRECVTILDRLPTEGVLITSRGRAVARIMPVPRNNAELIGALAGKFEIRGDIYSTGEQWNADAE